MGRRRTVTWTEVVRVPELGPCLEWGGRRDSFGYGQVHRDGVSKTAHRYAYEQAHGPIPAGLDVLHRCDNPPCGQDSHLFLGNDLANMRDKMAKGRGAHLKGSALPQAKLTESDIRVIRELRHAGATCVSIASRFNVSRYAVSKIVNYTNWKHVTQETSNAVSNLPGHPVLP